MKDHLLDRPSTVQNRVNPFLCVYLPETHAGLIADLLVDADLGGVVSHGVLQIEHYVHAYPEGRTNPHPISAFYRKHGLQRHSTGTLALG